MVYKDFDFVVGPKRPTFIHFYCQFHKVNKWLMGHFDSQIVPIMLSTADSIIGTTLPIMLSAVDSIQTILCYIEVADQIALL